MILVVSNGFSKLKWRGYNYISALAINKFMNILKLMLEKIKLQIAIIQAQLAILLFKQKRTVPNLDWPRFIILHHEGANNGFKKVNEWHRQKWGFKSSLGFYCGYQWYLDKLKIWYQARRDTEEGAHCPGHNKDSIGICIMGNYGREVLDKDLAEELTKKVDELRVKYNIPRENVLGDKEGRIVSRPTSCPEGLMEWIINYRNT